MAIHQNIKVKRSSITNQVIHQTIKVITKGLTRTTTIVINALIRKRDGTIVTTIIKVSITLHQIMVTQTNL